MRKVLATLTTLCAMLAGLMATAPQASAAVYGAPLYGSLDKNVCATPKGNGTANGTIITTWSCTGSDLQKWRWNGNSIVHSVSGKCLTPQGDDSNRNGAVLTLWTCSDAISQAWVEDYTTGYSRIFSLDGGKCLTPKGNSFANGSYLTIWTCDIYIQDVQAWSLYA
ncbi:RICIN domain-containing protein [Streptomyces griseus]|uniref:RICIN domain-containing protein n=1 Tax=Streptomyces griseus TaxID=1911 RepID=UPI0004CC1358|nr:RICIN domain-containing protein [Streptomyces griseus]